MGADAKTATSLPATPDTTSLPPTSFNGTVSVNI
jgi:hypothetical protein